MKKKREYIKEYDIEESQLISKMGELRKLGYSLIEQEKDYYIMFKKARFPWIAYILFMPLFFWIMIPLRLTHYRYYIRINIIR